MQRLKTEVRAERVWYRNRIKLAVIQKRQDGRMDVGQPLTMKTIGEDEVITEPTLSLNTDEAQLLMDEMWRCGLRPSEGSGSAGSLAATERHLKDMRTVAMGLLARDGVPGVGAA